MATDLANITITGRLARDASMKDAGSSRLCEFTLGHTFLDGREECTAWYKCALWGKRGESLQPYLEKGKLVVVSGRFSPRKWTNREGVEVTELSIDVQDLTFGGGGKNEERASESGGASGWE